MREHVLRDFFIGRLDATALDRDLNGSVVRRGFDEAAVRLVDLEDGEHLVTAEHLVRLCVAVERGLLDPWKLAAIAFCLLASDHFRRDETTAEGARIGRVLRDWSAPQVGYPLTVSTVAKARHLLQTGEDTFTADDRHDVPERTWPAERMTKQPEKELGRSTGTR